MLKSLSINIFGGATRNVRWLLNTNGYNNGASTPIFSSFVLGQESYGVVRLGAKEAEFLVKPLGASGTADPLNQRGTVGYKYPFTTRINFISNVLYKSTLIDMEALEGDMAEAA